MTDPCIEKASKKKGGGDTYMMRSDEIWISLLLHLFETFYTPEYMFVQEVLKV